MKAGDEVVLIGSWREWGAKRVTIVRKHHDYKNNKAWVVDFSPDSSWSDLKFIPEDCLVLKVLFESPLYEALK